MPRVTKIAQASLDADKAQLPLLAVNRTMENQQRPGIWRRWGIGVGIVAVAAGATAYQLTTSSRAEKAAASALATAAIIEIAPTVAGLATLQPRDGVIEIALPAGAGDAVIRQIMVQVGDSVAAGQALAYLDTRPKLSAAVAQAEANVVLREAETARTRASLQADHDDAKAAVGVAEVVAANARRVADRAVTLAQNNAMSAAASDDLIAARQQADGELDRARVKLARFSAAKNTHPDIVAAEAAVAVSRAALASAETDLAQSVVIAPTSGTILSITSHPGERPGTNGILRMANTEAMIARVEVFQDRIHAISLADTVSLTSNALITPLRGTVTAIGSEVLPQAEISDDAAANTNARVVEVTVTLDAASTLAGRSLTNLQVVAVIAVGNAP